MSRAHFPTSLSWGVEGGHDLAVHRSRFPTSHVLVLKSETFFERTRVVYHRVTDFLGLSRMALGPARTSGGGTSNPVAPGEQALRDYFEPYNASLHDLLGAELAWQRRSAVASP